MNARAWLVVLFLAIAGSLAPSSALARSPAPPPAPNDSWAGQLEGLAQWIAAHKTPDACTERCFTLHRLRLTGSVEAKDALRFELEGSVLADGAVAVPLFGPPDKVRLDAVTEDGKPAAIGFEGDHYFVHTASKRFVLRGTLAFQDDLALTIAGPLNLLEADFKHGRLVEGARLSGLSQSTIHLEVDAGTPAPATAPTVFQLARAVRVGRDIAFEYRLTMRSGIDLGVVRLPLKYGERVLDVAGSAGWHVENGELVLPTAGHDATMTITGTLPQVAAFAPDDRSPFETWLLESDLEHRMTVSGDAKRIDLSQSPFQRWTGAVTSQLFMVPRGEKLDVTVQSLVATEALAATVRAHGRMVVLTPSGDLVSDDTLTYDNNGVDYLSLWSQGRPIFLSTDGRPERLFHREGTIDELQVPLRVGAHSFRTQSLSHASVGSLFGVIEIPTPTHSLATARASLTLGLPEGVRPIGVLGGDQPRWSFGARDAAAIVAAIVVAFIALRGRARRVLGAIALGGLWFVSSSAYTAALCVAGLATVAWIVWRLTAASSRRRVLWTVAATAAAAFGLLVTAPSRVHTADTRRDAPYAWGGEDGNATLAINAPAPSAAPDDQTALDKKALVHGQAFSIQQNLLAKAEKEKDLLAAGGAGGVMGGVTPVALALPSYARTVVVESELVTPERPFRPRVVYVTATAVMALGGAWLAAIALLAWAMRGEARELLRRARERLAKPAPAPAPAE